MYKCPLVASLVWLVSQTETWVSRANAAIVWAELKVIQNPGNNSYGEIKLNFKSMLRRFKQDKILKISSLEYIVICIQFRWFHIHGIQLITVYRFLYSLDFGYHICGLKLRRMEVPERSYFLHHLRQSGDRVWVKTSMFFEEKIKTQ